MSKHTKRKRQSIDRPPDSRRISRAAPVRRPDLRPVSSRLRSATNQEGWMEGTKVKWRRGPTKEPVNKRKYKLKRSFGGRVNPFLHLLVCFFLEALAYDDGSGTTLGFADGRKRSTVTPSLPRFGFCRPDCGLRALTSRSAVIDRLDRILRSPHHDRNTGKNKPRMISDGNREEEACEI